MMGAFLECVSVKVFMGGGKDSGWLGSYCKAKVFGGLG